MLQSKSRLLELNAKLAETLTSKGVTATADETTTALVNKVSDIKSGDDSVLRGLIQRNLTEIVIPDGVKNIGISAFKDAKSLAEVIFNDNLLYINDLAFAGCINLTTINIPNSVTVIGGSAFMDCIKLKAVNMSNKVITIYNNAFYNCTNLTTINIPNSIKIIGGNTVFYKCKNLIDVRIADDFNCNNLDLSASTLYARETILQWLNALADRTGQTAYKLTIGAKNLAKLTEEDILIATNKNWTLA